MQDSSEKPSLYIHEWLAVMGIMGLLGFLTLVSWWNQRYPAPLETGAPHFVIKQEIDITIEGAVEQPGVRKVKRGTTVREALEQAILLPEADVGRLKLDAKVRRHQIIKVPTQPFIAVTVEGAVDQPGLVKMPKGARLLDLIEKIAFAETADIEKLRKKRRLKDGEVVVVPVKK